MKLIEIFAIINGIMATVDSVSNVSSTVSKDVSSPWVQREECGVLATVGKVARAAIILVGVVLANTITLGIPLIFRAIQWWNQRSIKQEIENQMATHLCTVLEPNVQDVVKESFLNGNTENKKNFIKRISRQLRSDQPRFVAQNIVRFASYVDQLKHDLEIIQKQHQKGKVSIGLVEALYEKFQAFAGSPTFVAIFKNLKSIEPNNELVEFLENLAERFYSANMKELLQAHVQERIEDLSSGDHKYPIGKIGDVLKQERDRNLCFRKDGGLSCLFWGITHPQALYNSWTASSRPDLYRPGASNPTYVVDEMTMDRVQLKFIAGPTPYNDPIYKHFFLGSNYELRFDIMDTSHKNERHMIDEMQTVANESSKHSKHTVLGFAAEEKNAPMGETGVDDIINSYEEQLLSAKNNSAIGNAKSIRENGMFIPYLSVEEIRLACEKAKNLVNGLQIGSETLKDKHTKHAILVVVDTMIALGTLIKSVQAHKDKREPLYVATACKQCFDRGPVYLLALRLFVRSLEKTDGLSSEEVYQIAGLPLFRAPLNEGREQISRKEIVLEAFTQMLGNHTEALSEQTKALKGELLS